MSAKALLSASVSAPPAVYVEDVFSTYLYTGNGGTQTITNGIDLSGKGGLVWIKGRSGATGHRLTDTARGATKSLESNSTTAEVTESTGLTSFSSTGFALGADADYSTNAATYASWTFRKAEKFFDVVTYTGNGSNRTIAHNLGSVPGTIIVKRTDTTGDWQVYHRSLANTEYIVLNSTAAKATGTTRWNSTTPTSTVFSLGTDATVNASGGTYVAYLFAHDAGGFGDSGSESVVKCGTFSGTGFVDLGWEPQWLLIKPYTQTYNWEMYDNMRGMAQPAGAGSARSLFPNLANAEAVGGGISFEATGFTQTSFGGTYPCIYIAIRRGPMKTPTDATKVFKATFGDADGIAPGYVSGFPVDTGFQFGNLSVQNLGYVTSRITGIGYLNPASIAAEVTAGQAANTFDFQNGFVNTTGNLTASFSMLFRRAPGFFDVVAYTGTGAALTVNHNLGVAPEIVIIKNRGASGYWIAGVPSLISGSYAVNFSSSNAFFDAGAGFLGNDSSKIAPTATSISLGSTTSRYNASANTYIAYLFATCPGVSKVGSYTGTGTTLNVDCGFTAGARFVLIKRTDSSGDWYVWDTARGIVSGNDPYLLLNSPDAEVTSTDYIDPLSSGFQISSTAPAAINASGGSFIFLAIA